MEKWKKYGLMQRNVERLPTAVKLQTSVPVLISSVLRVSFILDTPVTSTFDVCKAASWDIRKAGYFGAVFPRRSNDSVKCTPVRKMKIVIIIESS